MSFKITGRGVSVSDGLREHVEEKLIDALDVFDIEPMTADVVLRVDKNRSNPLSEICEITVRVPKSVIRVSEVGTDMYDAIDTACAKVSRQLRKYKTKVVDRHKRDRKERSRANLEKLSETEFEALFVPTFEEDDVLVREKLVELRPMSVDDALVQCDLLGHDFYMFEEQISGEINVVYRRASGGYGLLKPVYA